jgi:hypothetical protein
MAVAGTGAGGVHVTVTSAYGNASTFVVRSMRLTVTVNPLAVGSRGVCTNEPPCASLASRFDWEYPDPGKRSWIVTWFWPSRVPSVKLASRLNPTWYSILLPYWMRRTTRSVRSRPALVESTTPTSWRTTGVPSHVANVSVCDAQNPSWKFLAWLKHSTWWW